MRTHRIHVDGLGFPEGPVVLPDGGIAFVDLTHAKIRVYRDGICRELCALPGAPNGMRLSPDGVLNVCNNGGIGPKAPGVLHRADPEINGRLQRVNLDGTWSDFAVDLPGKRPNRPNDLVFTPNGDIVFTDPQNWDVFREPDGASRYHGGQLLLARPNGSVEHLADMTGFPNGLAFHPDGSLLVGISLEHRIVRFPWLGDRVGPVEEWLRLDDKFAPDGMVFHGDTLYVTGSSGDRVAVLDPNAGLVEMIDMGPGSNPTNCCVQDRLLWLTLGMRGQLVSIDM
jgi:sugar lactone lactonase YvrE